MRFLQRLLQPSQHRGGARGVLVDPAVVDEPYRYRVEKVQLLPSRSAGDDQSRVLQYPQVLHDTEPADLHLRLQLGQRAAVTLEEQVEQEAARRIRERLEDQVVIVHCPGRLCDRKVTCQVGAAAVRRRTTMARTAVASSAVGKLIQ